MSKDKQKTSLNAYEAELEKKIDNAAPLNDDEKVEHKTALVGAAKEYAKKDTRISIRVYGNDLKKIKEIAEREGLPYQTLITSILHKFATGILSNRNHY